MEIPTFAPRLRVLNREQAETIHASALRILEKIGFKMEHAGAREMLAGAGAKVEGDWVYLPPAPVEAALKSAPREIKLYDQKGNPAMNLAGENSYYGTGSDAIFTLDLETGERRRTILNDVANFARLVDGLDNFDFVMSMANPEDVPVEDIYVYVFAEMVKNSNKPIVFIADSGRDIALDMVDTNHMRFKSGLVSLEETLRKVEEEPRVKFFIIQESPFWLQEPVQNFLERYTPAAVFEEPRERIVIFDCRKN